MLVKCLLVLLIIFQNTKSESNSQKCGIIFGKNTCRSSEYKQYEKPITIEFNKLEKYETEKKSFENVFFNEIRIFHLSWDQISNTTGSSHIPCGLYLSPTSDSSFYISNTIGYYKGEFFNNITHDYIHCNIHQCDLGLIFFNKHKNAAMLNNVDEFHRVEHAVLIIIKSSDNKMLLASVQYHNVNIEFGFCPYIEWVPKKGVLKFIPEESIKDNGYFSGENKYTHIMVPFYKKDYNTKEFICGRLKQPTLPDLFVGYKFREDNINIEVSGSINPLNEEIKCQPSDDLQYHYHFGYSETDTNYMSERIMEPIKVRNKDSQYKFYAGQKIYIYEWGTGVVAVSGPVYFSYMVRYLVNKRVKCIKNLKKDIQANILPTIGSLDSIQKHKKKNIFYRLIKSDDLGKNYTFRCLSKVEGMNKAHMDEFYSRSAEFSIKNEEKPNITYTLTKNKIIFDPKKIDNYGSYRCKESNVTKVFNKSVITMDEVYYLPDEDSELSLEESYIGKTFQKYTGCNRKFGTFGEIKKMRIEFGENVSKPIDIDDFSNVTDKIDIKENLIIYKPPENVSGLIMKCIYETPAETTFFTKKEFHLFIRRCTESKDITSPTEMNNKIVTESVNNSTLWIAVIVIIVVLFCIIITILGYLLVRKTEKRKVKNSFSLSLSASGLSQSSEINSNESNGISGIPSKTTGKRKDVSRSIEIKKGKLYKTFTSFTNDSESETSTELSKNYFKNVKLVVK
uniref:Ig-like domain-containing protein n=1 Tax=Strongyloides papillosus TaxID=174720 RepID=A0A0N5CDX5_STREA